MSGFVRPRSSFLLLILPLISLVGVRALADMDPKGTAVLRHVGASGDTISPDGRGARRTTIRGDSWRVLSGDATGTAVETRG